MPRFKSNSNNKNGPKPMQRPPGEHFEREREREREGGGGEEAMRVSGKVHLSGHWGGEGGGCQRIM